MINVERQYKIAATLVGDHLSKDLVHHCLILMAEKAAKVKYEDAYFGRIMINESKRGRFTKAYEINAHIVHKQPISVCHATTEPQTDNTKAVNKILREIAADGYLEEVAIVRLKLNGCTINQIAEALGLCRQTISSAIAFVKEQIKVKYENSYY